jgi:hypothetical protein
MGQQTGKMVPLVTRATILATPFFRLSITSLAPSLSPYLYSQPETESQKLCCPNFPGDARAPGSPLSLLSANNTRQTSVIAKESRRSSYGTSHLRERLRARRTKSCGRPSRPRSSRWLAPKSAIPFFFCFSADFHLKRTGGRRARVNSQRA